MVRIKILTTIFLVIFFTIVLQGCKSDNLSDKDIQFYKFVTTADVNDSITIEPNPSDPHKTVVIRNKSNDYIGFENNYSLRVFYFDEDRATWVEGRNNVVFFGEAEPLSPGSPNDFSTLMIVLVDPKFENKNPAVIRVLVSGKIIENGLLTDKIVSAYTDFNIK